MKKISSGSTFFNKKVVPVMWISFVLVLLVAGILSCAYSSKPFKVEQVFFLFGLVLLLLGGLAMFRWLVFCLADEVYYDEESLLVINDKKELRIHYSNIKNIKYICSRPPRIELELFCDTELGNALSFSPVCKWFVLRPEHPDILDFIEKAGIGYQFTWF